MVLSCCPFLKYNSIPMWLTQSKVMTLSKWSNLCGLQGIMWLTVPDNYS